MPAFAPVIAAAATVGGSLISASGQRSAAKAQARSADRAADLQRQTALEQRELLQPFVDIGTGLGLPGLYGLATPEGQADFLGEYFAGPEYQTLSQAAQRSSLAGAEATGALGGSATQNTLARIAPELGLAALERQRGIYGDLANIGLAGAGQTAGFLGQSAQGQAQSVLAGGQARAAGAGAFGQALGGVLGQLGGFGLAGGFGGAPQQPSYNFPTLY